MDVQECPSCGGAERVPTGREVKSFVVTAGPKEFLQETYSVYECRTCGLLYKSRTLSPSEFAEYYARADFRKWEIAGLYPTERAVLRILRTLPQGSRILDIGCSSGRLLAHLVGPYQCFGYEVNESAVREAEAKRIMMLSVEELDVGQAASYDAIVMVDVFEHLQRPLEVLTKLGKLLKAGGWLVVVTGDGGARPCSRDPAQFWYFQIIEHICMLTTKHAAWIETQLNMKLKTWQRVCHYDWNWRYGSTQMLSHWAYWQFRQGSMLIRSILRRLPKINRAESWPVAPSFCYSDDHVVAVFEK